MTKEEMEQQIHDFAEMMYKVGFEDGQKTYKTMYSAGIEDAWNTAQLTIRMWFKHFKQDANEFDKFFELNGKLGEDVFELFFKKYSPSEVLAKISDKEYEEQQKALSVTKFCSILNDECPYPYIICKKCDVHCSIERAKNKLKGDKK